MANVRRLLSSVKKSDMGIMFWGSKISGVLYHNRLPLNLIRTPFMHITQFQVEHFRNLASQLVPLSPQINLITGTNGAGKTALLEAIYFLGRQRSFRTNQLPALIQQDKSYFRLIAKTADPDHQIGLERRVGADKKLSFLLRLDRETQKSPAKLAKIVPTIAITSRSFQLIDAGPVHRRQFMDYGAFHFSDSFFTQWKIYQKALKNRNAALKQQMPRAVVDSFSAALIPAGESVHTSRKACFAALKPLLTKHLIALNFPYAVTIRYTPGWNTEHDLADSLHRHFDYDFRLRHTRYGPHRADIKLAIDGGSADHRLSRGQQKTLILAMHLAQIDLIGQYGNAEPLLIFDDIAAELDIERRNLVLAYLANLHCQMFFSATEPELFDADIRQRASLIQLQNGQIKG